VPSQIFERLWRELGIKKVIRNLLSARRSEFDLERTIFLTVLHRLFASGSDRYCDKWHRDYLIEGVDDISLHHLYRVMAFIGEEAEDQKDRTPFSPLYQPSRLPSSIRISGRWSTPSGISSLF